MATVDVNGTTIHFERTGQGPSILFVHGSFGDGDVWSDQAARLGAQYTCVRYDRRGHTASARGEAPLSYGLHADDAAALIEALGLAPCLLVGSSAGGVIGIDVARRHGHLLRGIVLSEPPLFSIDLAAGTIAKAELAPIIGEATSPGGSRAAIDAFMHLICPGLWDRIGDARREAYRANADVGFADMAAPPIEITHRDLAGITVPALLIGADSSHPALRSVARALAAGLPNARFLEFERCGHVTYFEQPTEFAAAVATFAAELDRHPARFDVRAEDGTSIAVWARERAGARPIVLVHGTLTDHTGFDDLVAALGSDVATYAVDRRGYGASGDGGEYRVEVDFGDVAAVVDAVAARTGRRVTLVGHSYGANAALGAATRTANLDHLILYEGSLGLGYPPGAVEAMEAALASDDREAVLEAVLGPLELSRAEIDELRAGPRWPVLLAGAPNGPREARAEQDWNTGYEPFAGIDVPTLLLTGDESPAAVEKLTREAAAAIPGSQVRTLHGHAHLAHRSDPALIASIVREFAAAPA